MSDIFNSTPCRKCMAPDRYPGCHSKCNKYIEWKTKLDEEKTKIRKAKDISLLIDKMHIATINNKSRYKLKRKR
jgi:hypothetical protein